MSKYVKLGDKVKVLVDQPDGCYGVYKGDVLHVSFVKNDRYGNFEVEKPNSPDEWMWFGDDAFESGKIQKLD